MSTQLDRPANLREQVLFGLVSFVLIVLFFKSYYTPKAAEVAELNKTIQTLNQEKQALTHFSSSMPVLKKEEATSNKKGVKVKILFGEIKSNFQDLSSVLSQITAPDYLGDVVIQKVSLDPLSLDKGYRRIDFSLNVLGNFQDLMQYLQNLEQFPALFTVQRLNLRTAEGHVQELEADIFIRFFELENTPLSEIASRKEPGTPKP